MKKPGCLFLLSFLWILIFSPEGSAQEEITSFKDTISFIHITDPHICNLAGFHPFFVQKRQHFGNNLEPLANFFRTVPVKYKSDFIVVTGDNIDYYEAQSEKNGVEGNQIEQYSKLIESVRIPVYLTLGNHDIASYYVGSDLAYTNNQLHAESARAVWMRNIPSFKDGTYYSHVFRIDTTVYRLIFLDNAYYGTKELKDDALPFLIDPAQLLWFDAQLKASPSDIEIVFMHMPVAYSKSNRDTVNAVPLSTYSSKGKFFNLFSVLGRNSSNRLFFVGHNHENLITNYVLPNGSRLTQVMTGAFGYNPDDWRIIKLTGNSILIYYPGSTVIENVIDIRNIRR